MLMLSYKRYWLVIQNLGILWLDNWINSFLLSFFYWILLEVKLIILWGNLNNRLNIWKSFLINNLRYLRKAHQYKMEVFMCNLELILRWSCLHWSLTNKKIITKTVKILVIRRNRNRKCWAGIEKYERF